jgi:hypothetical protein
MADRDAAEVDVSGISKSLFTDSVRRLTGATLAATVLFADVALPSIV